MAIFKPDLYLSNIFEVTPKLLKNYNIKALLLDVDNTIAVYHTDYPIEGVTEWIEEMKKNGIKLFILSNSKPKRLIRFAKKVELDYFYMSLKPLPFKISRAVKKIGLLKKEVALVGDQMFTDILGGNLCGVKTIWLDYIKIENSTSFRLKRKIEEKIKVKLVKGVK